VADYPFTTLHPNLGVVRRGDRDLVIADIPGLIEGAHEGHGLGDRFLGHVERCGALIHLVDGAGGDTETAYRTIRAEIEAYGHGLADKPELVALNKADALDGETLAIAKAMLEEACGKPVHVISGIAGTGIDDLIGAVIAAVDQAREREAEAAPAEPFQP
jgi:GTP-binding protein